MHLLYTLNVVRHDARDLMVQYFAPVIKAIALLRVTYLV